MHHRRIAGPYFNGTHPGVLLKRVRDEKGFDLTRPFRGNLVGFRNRNHHIRLDAPAVGPLNGLRLILRVAFGSAPIGPRRKSRNLPPRQCRIIAKTAVTRIGEPRRHFPRDNGLLDGLRPRAGRLVSQKRHGSGLTRPMANLTIFLQYR